MPLITSEPAKEKRLLLTAGITAAFLVVAVALVVLLEALDASASLIDTLSGATMLCGPGVALAAWRYAGARMLSSGGR